MNSSVVCYLTDRGYLFPTFMSAVQARSAASKNSDVVVFSTNNDERLNDVFAAACQAEGIQYRAVGAQLTQRLDQLERDNPSHFSHRIPATTFGRLFLYDVLPAHYDSFLYIDSDTQVVDSLDPLLNFAVPDGKFLAARDYCSLLLAKGTRDLTPFPEHVDRLRLTTAERRNYFNAGVLRANRKDWQSLAAAALEFYLKHPELCSPFHDQGALNGACRSSHVLMSTRWNMPRPLMHLNVSGIRPAIVHFMAAPKPWHGGFYPWGRRYYACYLELAQRHPSLAAYLPRLTLARALGYAAKTTKNALIDLKHKATEQRVLDAESRLTFAI